MTEKLDIYTRDDRDDLRSSIDALVDLATFAEAYLVMERYGLSIEFCEDDLTWSATDPKGLYLGHSNTPCGAVLMWDMHREDVEGKDKGRPRLRLLRNGVD